MENPPNPYEPTPHATSIPNFHMLYYALVLVGTAIIVLALYNLIILRWSSNVTSARPPQNVSREMGPTSSRRLDNLNLNSFKYKKDRAAQDEGNGYECAVCLSVFEEGEELRQLPNCKHSFHAPCIDTWIYSHMDCPLCRAPVELLILRRRLDSIPPVQNPSLDSEQVEHSREGSLFGASLL